MNYQLATADVKNNPDYEATHWSADGMKASLLCTISKGK
jgi:hypothetical protein